MEYLIFSDESGAWKAGDYYIRTWIRLSPEDYELISKDIVFIKHKMNFKELKWNSIKKNAAKIKSIIESLFGITAVPTLSFKFPVTQLISIN